MIQKNLTQEIIKSTLFVIILIIVSAYLTYLILNNIMGSKTTSFHNDDGLMVEIQEVINKEITTELDNDNRKVVVTNNSDELVTYDILLSSNSNLEDLLVRVDNRIRNLAYLTKVNNYYVLDEYDLEVNETKQTIINVYLAKGDKREVKINLKVVKKGDLNE